MEMVHLFLQMVWYMFIGTKICLFIYIYILKYLHVSTDVYILIYIVVRSISAASSSPIPSLPMRQPSITAARSSPTRLRVPWKSEMWKIYGENPWEQDVFSTSMLDFSRVWWVCVYIYIYIWYMYVCGLCMSIHMYIIVFIYIHIKKGWTDPLIPSSMDEAPPGANLEWWIHVAVHKLHKVIPYHHCYLRHMLLLV